MLNRREFVVTCAVAALWRPSFATPEDVIIVQFSDTGERQGRARVAKVEKSADEWRCARLEAKAMRFLQPPETTCR
jgi:hypothetical protein